MFGLLYVVGLCAAHLGKEAAIFISFPLDKSHTRDINDVKHRALPN